MSRAARSSGRATARQRRPMSSLCSSGTSRPSSNPMKSKRVEVKLSLPVVAPLLDIIRELSVDLEKTLAAPQALHDLDQDFRGAWIGELLEGQNGDLRALLSLFDGEFFTVGVIAFDEKNAEPIVRACTALRLKLRESRLKALGDESLETGDVDMEG